MNRHAGALPMAAVPPCRLASTTQLRNRHAAGSVCIVRRYRYYVRPCSKPQNRAAIALAVRIGSVVETEQERGVAHILEHLVSRVKRCSLSCRQWFAVSLTHDVVPCLLHVVSLARAGMAVSAAFSPPDHDFKHAATMQFLTSITGSPIACCDRSPCANTSPMKSVVVFAGIQCD